MISNNFAITPNEEWMFMLAMPNCSILGMLRDLFVRFLFRNQIGGIPEQFLRLKLSWCKSGR